ncbi:MAG: hypothetical protein DBW74_04355 [Cryomorphaceae bacterium]|nr:MAG: hypothetical protein DBW74_04355 [Cryomorphaceae bacterium]
MNKYYTLFFSLFFLSISSQNDLEKIKNKYQSINSYNLNYNLVVSTLKENNTVVLIEESGIMYGNNSSFMIKHKNMDIISDGKKIYNVIHNIREINITEYSNNNLWNPINIFKNLLNRLNSSIISYNKDYILVEFLISDLNKVYKFFLDRNYDVFKLELTTSGSKSKTTIFLQDLIFSNKIYNIVFDHSNYENYYLNKL